MSDPRKLLHRYVVALGLILAFTTVSHVAAVSVINDARQQNEIISESINQKRRVSQIVSFAELVSILNTKVARDSMRRETDALERVHFELAAHENLTPAVRDLYFRGGERPALHPLMRKFIEDARLIASGVADPFETAPALQRLRRSGLETLPAVLQKVNEGHQLEASAHSSMLAHVQSATFLLALFVLACEAAFIFAPAHRGVRAAFDALSAKTERLRRAQDELETRNRELERLRADAEREAMQDGLTGLGNRRAFEREIARMSEAARAGGREIAVLHIDLDRFKEINDTLGHAAGDAVLRHVGQVLRALSEPADLVARVGGDEFVIARQHDGPRATLEPLAQRLVDELGRPVQHEDAQLRVGASVGVAVGCGGDPGRLVADADIALYHAKELGRGRFAVFAGALRRELEERKALSDELALALDRGEIQPFYQPQVDARTGALRGVEALARWRHPQRGDLSPAVFLPIAERLRVAPAVDRAVQDAVLRDLARWDARGLEVPRVAINVSPARLRDPDLRAFARSEACPRGRLSIEILETLFADRLDDETRHAVDALREAGVDIEIDDFGTGHASLLGLFALSASRLKIARELVAPLPDSPRHAGMIGSICEIARSLDMGVIAEGVETEAQLTALSALGCDCVQGYLIARPMPVEAFEAWLADGRAAARA